MMTVHPPPPSTTAPGAPFSLAHARSGTEAVLARTFSSRGAGAALLGAARSDLPPGGLARCVSDAAALAAAAAAAAEYEAAGDDWDLAALAAVASDTAGDDGRSVREGLAPPPPACCSYAALHGASVGDCGCCKDGGAGAPTVALTVDAAPRSHAPPPGAAATSSQGPLAALEDIHDIVRDYVDACAEFELRPAAAAFAPPRDGGRRGGRRRAETGGCNFGAPDTPASDGALSIDSDGGAWGSPTGRVSRVGEGGEEGGRACRPSFRRRPQPHTPTLPSLQSTCPSIDSELSMPFTRLALTPCDKPPHALAPLRTSRRRRGRRGTLDGGCAGGESSDDAALSVSPAW